MSQLRRYLVDVGNGKVRKAAVERELARLDILC
jgi:hypothetical protein